MNLFYSRGVPGNFGDDLNPLIWYSLYPKLFETSTSQDTILGIGTLINERAPSIGRLHVLGSGVGYHGGVKIDDRWNFVFLRGPKSCASLGLDSALAVTDPAILIKRIFPIRERVAYNLPISYMPHHVSCDFANWPEICEMAGLQYLDPRGDVSETLHKIRNSRMVIAEAMHGAIVADALRVPWLAVKAYSHILDFKWLDWCESIGVAYSPVVIPSIWDSGQSPSPKLIIKDHIKRFLISKGIPGDKWTPPSPLNNRKDAMPKLVDVLITLQKDAEPSLSLDSVHFSLLDKVEHRVDKFIRDGVNSGILT